MTQGKQPIQQEQSPQKEWPQYSEPDDEEGEDEDGNSTYHDRDFGIGGDY